MNYTAEQLGTIIKMAAKKDVIDLGEEEEQDFFIYEWMNMFLQQFARKAYLDTWSDELSVFANGFFSFQASAQDISDIYEPLSIYHVDGDVYKQVKQLKSFDGGNGWYRAGANSLIYLRGQSGMFKLHYLRYPAKVTLGSDIPEYPPAGYQEMITWIVAQIKLTKNYYEENQAVNALSNKSKLAAINANKSARGSNQAPPSDSDAGVG